MEDLGPKIYSKWNKKPIQSLRRRKERIEERFSEHEDRATEITQFEQQRENRLGRGRGRNISDTCGTLTKDS